MRVYLFIAFLGMWVAVIPFLPISCGSTQTAVLLVSGLAITVLAVWLFRKSEIS